MKLFKLRSENLTPTAGRHVHVSNPKMALLILFGTFIAMMLIVSVITGLINSKLGETTASVRIMNVMQDLFVFILPAIVTAVVATKLPATFLRIDAGASTKTLLMSLVVLICSTPAMNFIIALNQSMVLPDFLAPLENWARSMEDGAEEAMQLMFGGTTVGDLIMSILIVGILAGFSEEIFFRGALQRTMRALRLGPNGAIWATAIIFSAMHFQFYGFIPRLLLGAYFGYLVWWSGSLWVPVLVHVCNNSIVVFMTWITSRTGVANIAEEFGASLSIDIKEIITIILSIAVTVIGIIILRRDAIASKNAHTAPKPIE